jgi:hypothetical protein
MKEEEKSKPMELDTKPTDLTKGTDVSSTPENPESSPVKQNEHSTKIDNTYYHGTLNNFNEFSLKKV